jgi:hypothetical protein
MCGRSEPSEWHDQIVGRLRKITAGIGWFVLLVVRGVLLWLFLIPAIVPWFLSLVFWPILRPFGVRIPVAFLYYSRWATYLLDAMLSRITPIQKTPWPWQVDVRGSRIRTWDDTFDLP